MTAALLRKELRTLAPFLALVLLIWGADLVAVPLSRQPDREPMARGLDLVGNGTLLDLMTFLLAFSLAAGLLVGEHDRGTLELLDSLPVSRGRVFAVKVGTALLILWTGPLMGVFEACAFHALSRDSLDPGFHPGILGAAFFVHAVQAFVFLAWGLLLAFLRRFMWVAAAMAYLTVTTLTGLNAAFGLLDPRSLITPAFEGQRWVIPWRLLGVQVGLASVALVVTGQLFLGAGDRILRGLARLRQSRSGRLLLAATAVIAVGAWGVLIGRQMARESDDAPSPYQATSRVTTACYTITFPARLGDRAAALARVADGVHERVRSFLAAEPVGPIAVNGTGIRDSARAQGLASWKSIRLDLPDLATTDAMTATLGHETVHVYAAALSDRRLETPFVNEGLARYLEERLFHPPAWSSRTRLVAAILYARQQARFEALMDAEQLRREQDPDIVYPLGAVFVSALVERYGDAAPARVLRAMGRKDAPTDLSGLESWNDAFQETGYDLELVVDAFYARLKDDGARWRPLIDSLPRLRASVHREGGRVGVEVRPSRGDLEADAVWCRFRASLESPREDWFYGERSEKTFWVASRAFPGGMLHYQLGLFDPRVGNLIWEPWTAVALNP